MVVGVALLALQLLGLVLELTMDLDESGGLAGRYTNAHGYYINVFHLEITLLSFPQLSCFPQDIISG